MPPAMRRASGPQAARPDGPSLPSRPARVVPRPLTGLASLLGVKMTSPAERDPFTGPDGPAGADRRDARLAPGPARRPVRGAARDPPARGTVLPRGRPRASAVAVLTDAGGRELATACALPAFVLTDVRARLGEVCRRCVQLGCSIST